MAGVLFLANFSYSAAQVDQSFPQGFAVPFDTCKPEQGVKFRGQKGSALTTKEISERLVGNTMLSVDRYGTFAIYYPDAATTVGWMPKEKGKGYSWSAGKVNFSGGQYCRTWEQWTSGKKVNCWTVHVDGRLVDREALYFTCENGVPDGDVHVILPGNYFEIEYHGAGVRGGKLTQNDAKAAVTIEKYFAKYVNK
jgi:hypothetical protein